MVADPEDFTILSLYISDLNLDAQDVDYLADHEDFGVNETEPDELEMGGVGAGGLDIGEA